MLTQTQRIELDRLILQAIAASCEASLAPADEETQAIVQHALEASHDDLTSYLDTITEDSTND